MLSRSRGSVRQHFRVLYESPLVQLQSNLNDAAYLETHQGLSASLVHAQVHHFTSNTII